MFWLIDIDKILRTIRCRIMRIPFYHRLMLRRTPNSEKRKVKLFIELNGPYLKKEITKPIHEPCVPRRQSQPDRLFLFRNSGIVFIMLIDVKLPSIVGNLTLMCMINFALSSVEQNKFDNLGAGVAVISDRGIARFVFAVVAVFCFSMIKGSNPYELVLASYICVHMYIIGIF